MDNWTLSEFLVETTSNADLVADFFKLVGMCIVGYVLICGFARLDNYIDRKFREWTPKTKISKKVKEGNNE